MEPVDPPPPLQVGDVVVEIMEEDDHQDPVIGGGNIGAIIEEPEDEDDDDDVFVDNVPPALNHFNFLITSVVVRDSMNNNIVQHQHYHTVVMNLVDTVVVLKQRVLDVVGVSVHQQILVVNHRIMRDNRQLRRYIQNPLTLVSLIRIDHQDDQSDDDDDGGHPETVVEMNGYHHQYPVSDDDTLGKTLFEVHVGVADDDDKQDPVEL